MTTETIQQQSPQVKKVTAYERQSKNLSAENWTSQHTLILKCFREGMEIGEIAEKVGTSRKTVSMIRNSDYFQQRISSYNNKLLNAVENTAAFRAKIDAARNILTEAAPQAATTMVTLSKIGTKEDKVRFDAAKDILDRAGLKPVEVIEARERVYSPEEMLKAQGTLRETETIITRLKHTTSTFILGDTSLKAPGPIAPLESPHTDDGSNGITKVQQAS